MATKVKTVTKWFARGGNIAKAGPFNTQIDAVNSMRLVSETDEQYRRMRSNWDNGKLRAQLKGGFPDDVFVWPEKVKKK